MAYRLVYLVTEDWYFLSHRLPMARAAKQAGFDVHVATRLGAGREAIEAEGFTPHALSWRRGSISPVDSLSSIIELRRLLRALRPDLLHNVAVKPVLLGSAASLGFKQIAVVNSLTGLGTSLLGKGLSGGALRHVVTWALGRLLRRPQSRTIVQNPDDREFVAQLGVPEQSIVIIPGSGVDTKHLVPLPEPSAPITAAYVGRMLRHKGVDVLVDAFARLKQQGVALELLLAGDCDPENPGSLTAQQLQEFASAYGICWLGHVADIRDVWSRAHFAVLASRGGEGLPKSLLEAAACGRPMIATDAPGCREIAIPDTALSVPIDDPEALAAAMACMASDAPMRAAFGARARKLAETRFSAEVIGTATVRLYQSLLKSRPCDAPHFASNNELA